MDPGNPELAEVRDMPDSGAFDKAGRGASGFNHTATPAMENADPNVAILVVVNGTLNALQSATKEPKLKRFVLGSSSGACTVPKPGKVLHNRLEYMETRGRSSRMASSAI
ncbi:hypothetical protein CCMA1212_005590 [Trichoderma ghanense]|uniref:Uncharacterized protein n=1 Tax=Trichoderma ghanense TaxID=65468 RepID=A0ABY2H429_9HYPO